MLALASVIGSLISCLFKEAKTSLKSAGKSGGTKQQDCGNKGRISEMFDYVYAGCLDWICIFTYLLSLSQEPGWVLLLRQMKVCLWILIQKQNSPWYKNHEKT